MRGLINPISSNGSSVIDNLAAEFIDQVGIAKQARLHLNSFVLLGMFAYFTSIALLGIAPFNTRLWPAMPPSGDRALSGCILRETEEVLQRPSIVFQRKQWLHCWSN